MEISHQVAAIVFVVLIFILIVGCVAKPGGSLNQTNITDVTNVTNATNMSAGNGICGGFAGFRCPDGYYCQYSNGNWPSYPDESGTCMQCPQYAPMSSDLIDICKGKNGTIITGKDGRGCNSPPRCSTET